jgi:hypothetical protein
MADVKVIYSGYTEKEKRIPQVLESLEKQFDGFAVLGSDSESGECIFRKNRIGGKIFIGGDYVQVMVCGARFEMVFDNVVQSRIARIEEIGKQITEKMDNPWITTRLMEKTKKNYLPYVLNPRLIRATGLDLQSSGLEIEGEGREVKIWSNLDDKTQLYVGASSELGKENITEQIQITTEILRQLKALRRVRKYPGEANASLLLGKKDMAWSNMSGVSDGGSTASVISGTDNYPISGAWASLAMARANLHSLFCRDFNRIMGRVIGFSFANRSHQIPRYSLNAGLSQSDDSLTPWYIHMELEKRLSAGTNYGDADLVVLNTMNAFYYFLSRRFNPQIDFRNFVSCAKNEKCICGQKFVDDPSKPIAQLSCDWEKGHILHEACWEDWKEKNPPKKNSLSQSKCPICRKDCSSYATPWDGKRFVMPSS